MKAYFAGGCFWCVTPVFREIPGVAEVVSGYCGGQEVNPTYEDVKHQRTGHRETLMLEYDPELVSFAKLMDIFFSHVDPFDEGGQYIDRGHSYTLAVYYTDERQKELAEKLIASLERDSGRTVFIAVEPFDVFYRAEEYHQDYDLKNPEAFEREMEESGRKERTNI